MTSAPENGLVIWITGLSGAGKTTVAKELMSRLPSSAILLDGDEMRTALELLIQSGYSREDRQRLAMTYSRWAKMFSAQGKIVVVATISMFSAVYEWNRQNIPNYFEIFLDVPEDVRRIRDRKNVYPGAKACLEHFVAGVDIPVDYPESPDLRIPYDENGTGEAIAKTILSFLMTKHLALADNEENKRGYKGEAV